MKRPYRPFRTPFARWLASALVTLALLVNGMAMAQAASAPMKDDCCAGMAGHHTDGGCHDAGTTCPSPDSDCDDQCLARCPGNTALPAMSASLPGSFQRQPAPIVSITRAFSSPPPSPGLRPPISA